MSVDAPNAAAGRFRTALALIANDQGGQSVAEKYQLTGKLKKLFELKPALGSFEEYTELIKAIADAGTHQEDWDPITTEQATFAGELTAT